MGILLASNNLLHWGNNPAKTVNVAQFDSVKVDYGIEQPDDTLYPLADYHAVPSGDTAFYYFDYYLRSTPSAVDDGWLADIYDGSGVKIAMLDIENGGVRAKVYGDSVVYGATAPAMIALAINKVKVRVTVNASEVTMEVSIGGAVFSTATSANAGGKGVARRWDFNSSDAMSNNNIFSQFIISDTDMAAAQMVKLSPLSAGTDSDLTGLITSLSDDVELTFMAAAVSGDKSSFTVDAYAGVGPIHANVITAKLTAGAGAPANFRFYLIIGGTRYYGSTQAIAAGATLIGTESWDVDPSDSAAWTEAKINAAEPGIEAVA